MAKRGRAKRSDIRVGVVGVGRGADLAREIGPVVGMRLAAVCDVDPKRVKAAGERFGVATFTDFDALLGADIDAVVLANRFHEHAPLAIRALQAGKHVLSETAACFTLAEGVALIRAAERSGCVYMLAENYAYMRFNQEMRRLYQAGRVGEFMYGEGEYVHPMDADLRNRLSPGVDHWRHWLPATYYCTHALAPIMAITDTWPVAVNGFIIRASDNDPVTKRLVARNDPASMIVLRMNNSAVVKLLQVYLRGESIWVRVHGSRGQMENLRHGDTHMVRLRREQFHEPRREPVEQIYLPNWPKRPKVGDHAGHGGSDVFVHYHFAEAIRRGEQPYLDVYRGVAMSIVGPLAYRSALEDSKTVEVPDFRNESARHKHAKDDWSPDPSRHQPGQPWPSVAGNVRPSRRAVADAKKLWRVEQYP